jgi:hypothetical protein
MRATLTLTMLLLTACASPREKCERVARRLMPRPNAAFVEQCAARAHDPETAKTIDCLLAVGPEGVFEKDLERCGAKQNLPPYFQF